MMAGSLEGKHAIITGAARGIGRACATAFAAQGADLTLLDRCADLADCPYPMGNRSQLEATAQFCREVGASVEVAVVDVRDVDAMARMLAKSVGRYGGVDALVNSAGIAAPAGEPLHAVEVRGWELMLGVDLTGTFLTMKVVLPAMLEKKAGSIINIASTAGMVGYRYFSAYVAAKHGVLGLTRAAALDYATLGIRVNALCPGSVRDDDMLEGRMLLGIASALQISADDYQGLFAERQPTHQLVEAADVAAAAVWLASDAARGVTGAVLPVDGAFTAR